MRPPWEWTMKVIQLLAAFLLLVAWAQPTSIFELFALRVMYLLLESCACVSQVILRKNPTMDLLYCDTSTPHVLWRRVKSTSFITTAIKCYGTFLVIQNFSHQKHVPRGISKLHLVCRSSSRIYEESVSNQRIQIIAWSVQHSRLILSRLISFQDFL